MTADTVNVWYPTVAFFSTPNFTKMGQNLQFSYPHGKQRRINRHTDFGNFSSFIIPKKKLGTKCIKLGHSGEEISLLLASLINNSPCQKKNCLLLWNRQVHYSVHSSPPVVIGQRQINAFSFVEVYLSVFFLICEISLGYS